MIFRADVKSIAEKMLRLNLKDSPSVLTYLLRKDMFEKFVDLLHVRVNELETMLFTRNINLNKDQIENFVQSAAISYADKQIDLMLGKEDKTEIKSLSDQAKENIKKRKEAKKEQKYIDKYI